MGGVHGAGSETGGNLSEAALEYYWRPASRRQMGGRGAVQGGIGN